MGPRGPTQTPNFPSRYRGLPSARKSRRLKSWRKPSSYISTMKYWAFAKKFFIRKKSQCPNCPAVGFAADGAGTISNNAPRIPRIPLKPRSGRRRRAKPLSDPQRHRPRSDNYKLKVSSDWSLKVEDLGQTDRIPLNFPAQIITYI